MSGIFENPERLKFMEDGYAKIRRSLQEGLRPKGGRGRDEGHGRGVNTVRTLFQRAGFPLREAIAMGSGRLWRCISDS